MKNECELTAVEAARRLNVGLDYLYSLLWTRKLAGRKENGSWRVPESAVVERLKRTGDLRGTVSR